MGEIKIEVGVFQSIGTSHFKGNIFHKCSMIFTKEWVVLSFNVTGKSKICWWKPNGLLRISKKMIIIYAKIVL